jgi:predicted pyridoxine 5'-phosphate oxidase superfamily flavin-nucleotide-binding protein
VLTADMKRALAEHSPVYAATVCPDGTPNLSPKGTAMAWDDRHIVFLDLNSPQTVGNLRAAPHIEINVVDPFRRKGFRFKGVAQVLTEGPLYEEIVSYYERHRSIARRRVRAVVCLEVRQARPLISPAYDEGATEQQVVADWSERFRRAIDQMQRKG